MFPKFSYSRLQLYILYIIYTIYIYIHYIYTICIYTPFLGSWDPATCCRKPFLVFLEHGATATRHRSSARHLARTIRDFLSQKQVPCDVNLSSHWDPAEFQLSWNGDTLSHTSCWVCRVNFAPFHPFQDHHVALCRGFMHLWLTHFEHCWSTWSFVLVWATFCEQGKNNNCASHHGCHGSPGTSTGDAGVVGASAGLLSGWVVRKKAPPELDASSWVSARRWQFVSSMPSLIRNPWVSWPNVKTLFNSWEH